MALLPLEAPARPPKSDRIVTAEVPQGKYATEEAWSKACAETAERIGKCVPYPRTTTYEWDQASICMRITVEARPDAV